MTDTPATTPTLAEQIARKREAYIDQLDAKARDILDQLEQRGAYIHQEAPRPALLIQALIRLEIERYDLEQLRTSPLDRARDKGLTRP